MFVCFCLQKIRIEMYTYIDYRLNISHKHTPSHASAVDDFKNIVAKVEIAHK